MPKPTIDYSLYLVTARNLLPPGKDYYESLEESLQGGVTLVQLREKHADTGEFIEVASRTKEICDKYSVPLLINDRIDVALAVSAAGVHVGQSDAPLAIARRLLGEDAIVGVSIGTPEDARKAVEGGADYLGIGAVYSTQTKDVKKEKILGPRGVGNVLEAVSGDVKTVTIGGVKSTNALRILYGSFAPASSRTLDGLAVVSDIVASSSPRDASRRLRDLVDAFKSRHADPAQALAAVERPAEQWSKEAAALIKTLREVHPLVQQMANIVTANDQANATIALGAAPTMAAVEGDQPDLSPIIGALLINMGTVNDDQRKSMLLGGRLANHNRKPLVFDPVGIGASSFRKEVGKELLDTWAPTVIKGNAGEIGSIFGSTEVASRGVDSVGPGFKNPAKIVQALAYRERCIVAMTGIDDYISDGRTVLKVSNGHALLGQITGSGCVTGTAVAAFCAAASSLADAPKAGGEDGQLVRGDMLLGTLAGVLATGIAAEIAAQRDDVRGPNTFRSAWIDELAHLTPDKMDARAKVEVVKV